MAEADAGPAGSSEGFRCGQCSVTYARQDHLRRHELTHGEVRPRVCEFCQARFHRKDILRRHYQNCKQRGARPIPSPQSRGRRRQACDRCAAQKLACDPGQPCRSCASKGHTCTRAHAQGTTSAAGVNTADETTVNAGSQHDGDQAGEAGRPPGSDRDTSPSVLADPTVPPSLSRPALTRAPSTQRLSAALPRGHMSTPFLSALLNTASPGLVDIFGYSSVPPEPLPEYPSQADSHGTHSSRAAVTVSPRPVQTPNLSAPDTSRLGGSEIRSSIGGQNQPYYTDMNGSFDLFALTAPGSTGTVPETSHERARTSMVGHSAASLPAFRQASRSTLHRLSENGSEAPDLETLSPTSRKIYELVMQLTNTYITLPKGHHAKGPAVKIGEADSFFTTANVLAFIQTYFHHFHAHFGVVHRATFQLETVSPRLLLAICMAGFLYFSSPRNIERGKTLLDLAEEFIYQDPILQRVARGESSQPVTDAMFFNEISLESLQAGFIMLVVQNWEGNPAAQRRARSFRLQVLVTLARMMSLTSMKSSRSSTSDLLQSFDWIGLGRREACVRLVHHLFVFDSSLCIFFNYPPKFASSELIADLPGSPGGFEATNGRDCMETLLSTGVSDGHGLSLRSTLGLLVSESISPTAKSSLLALKPLDLLILIHALHQMIWQLQSNISLGDDLTRILQRAVTRWKNIWDWIKERISVRELRRSGFVQHADEYWWLACLKLEVGSQRNRISFEDDQMAGFRQLMEPFRITDSVDDFEFSV